MRVLIWLTVGFASFFALTNYWERAFASRLYVETSPEGCLRAEAYRPFWLLPDMLHSKPDSHPDGTSHWFASWEYPMFMRLVEVSSGKVVGESVTFDGSLSGGGLMDWGDEKSVGHRTIRLGTFDVADTTECADRATMHRLGEAYAIERRDRRVKRLAGVETVDSNSGHRWLLYR